MTYLDLPPATHLRQEMDAAHSRRTERRYARTFARGVFQALAITAAFIGVFSLYAAAWLAR